jgi:hypothetical protein
MSKTTTFPDVRRHEKHACPCRNCLMACLPAERTTAASFCMMPEKWTKKSLYFFEIKQRTAVIGGRHRGTDSLLPRGSRFCSVGRDNNPPLRRSLYSNTDNPFEDNDPTKDTGLLSGGDGLSSGTCFYLLMVRRRWAGCVLCVCVLVCV